LHFFKKIARIKMGKKYFPPETKEKKNRQAEPRDTARTGWPEEETPSEEPVKRADSLEEELYTSIQNHERHGNQEKDRCKSPRKSSCSPD
jgi:hypothetical protein